MSAIEITQADLDAGWKRVVALLEKRYTVTPTSVKPPRSGKYGMRLGVKGFAKRHEEGNYLDPDAGSSAATPNGVKGDEAFCLAYDLVHAFLRDMKEPEAGTLLVRRAPSVNTYTADAQREDYRRMWDSDPPHDHVFEDETFVSARFGFLLPGEPFAEPIHGVE